MNIQMYDFSEHICSTECIYIGPKNVTTAGDAINIKLDENCQLLDYVIERIEPQ